MRSDTFCPPWFRMASVLSVFYLFYFLMGDVRVASLNINGARDCGKRAKLYELVKQKRLDVIFVQETHSDVSNAADWAKEWEGLAFLSHNSSFSGGVAVLLSQGFTPYSYSVDEILNGRLLKVTACFENNVFVFICVYAPTGGVDRMSFLDTLDTVIAGCGSDEFLILGGDFNCTADSLDRNHMEPHAVSRKRLCEMLEAHDLCDVWRNFHGGQRQYTWAHSRDNALSLARLDRFYGFRY